MKRLISLILIHAMLLALTGCGTSAEQSESQSAQSQAVQQLTNEMVHVVEQARSADVSELFPDGIYVDVSDPDAAGVTVSNDIIYYEDGHDFTYGEGSEEDAHTADEAAEHTVLTITQPGTYVLSGTLQRGQIAVDLGDDAEDDPNAVVTLVLNGLDVTCTVAPAVIFYNVYECGSDDVDSATKDVDTSAAGANVIIPDGSVNHVRGSYVARIYKSVVLSDDGKEVIDSKKLHKYDGAFYSKMSMNISGGEENSGVLNIEAENEGLDSELHLTVNGGIINIISGNDGINTNEDEVSVTTINGGTVNIVCDGSTGEGDGIDSNGWLVINGGAVYAQACATSGDAGIDSDMGIYINGGTVMAGGNMLDRIAGGNGTYAVFEFAQSVAGGQSVLLKDADGEVFMHYTAENAFSYLVLSADTMTAGDYTLWVDDVQMAHSGTMTGGMGGGRGGMGGRMPDNMEMPEDFDPSQMGDREMPEGFDPSQMEGKEMPEGFDPSQMGDMEMPEDFDPSQMGDMEMPEGFDPSQMGDMEMPEDFDPSQMGDMEMPEGFDPSQMEGKEMPEGGFGGRDQGGANMGGEQSEFFSVAEGSNLFGGVSEYTETE